MYSWNCNWDLIWIEDKGLRYKQKREIKFAWICDDDGGWGSEVR
jgi:hypothetical protein